MSSEDVGDFSLQRVIAQLLAVSECFVSTCTCVSLLTLLVRAISALLRGRKSLPEEGRFLALRRSVYEGH